MGYNMSDFDKYLVEVANFHSVWCEWARNKPSLLRHPVKYIKWYFSEPKYEDFRKETNK